MKELDRKQDRFWAAPGSSASSLNTLRERPAALERRIVSLRFVARCGERLPEILTGKVEPRADVS